MLTVILSKDNKRSYKVPSVLLLLIKDTLLTFSCVQSVQYIIPERNSFFWAGSVIEFASIILIVFFDKLISFPVTDKVASVLTGTLHSFIYSIEYVSATSIIILQYIAFIPL